MALTWADVSLVAPDLASLGTTAQDAILADVADQVNVDAWGSQERADRAAAYLAAHIAVAGGYTGLGASSATGPVVSQSAGPYSQTFANPAGMSVGNLSSTRWGQEYERRMKAMVVGRIGLVA